MPDPQLTVDEAVRAAWADVLAQPGPVIVAPSVPLPIQPISILDKDRLQKLREWVLWVVLNSSTYSPIGSLEP